MRWYFEADQEDETIWLSARLDESGIVGDARAEVKPGEDFYGVSYDEMADAGGGVVEVGEDQKGRIVEEETAA